jgi:hypothetical protein
MKAFSFSVGIVVFSLTLFLLGLFGSNTLPLFAGFCLWTPAVFMLGFTVRAVTVGRRLRWEKVEEKEYSPLPPRPQNRLERLTKEKTL